MAPRGVVVFVVVLVLSVAMVTLTDATLLKKYKRHVRQLSHFSRQGPQPRVTDVTHAVTLATHERVQPAATVLHRCDDQVGCCVDLDPNVFECGPDLDHVHVVKLWFLVVDTITGRRDFRDFPFLNHTRCRCTEKTVDFDRE